MNLEKYTERARGFVQSAQSLALRENHQRFTPEHVLKVLLDDEEGLAAGLIDRAGGNSREALAEVVGGLEVQPKPGIDVEKSPQPDRRVGRHVPALPHDVADPVSRHADRLAKGPGGEAERLQIFLGEDFTGVGAQTGHDALHQ